MTVAFSQEAAYVSGDQRCVSFTAAADVAAGTVKNVGGVVSIVVADTKTGELGDYATGGIWRFNKVAGGGEATFDHDVHAVVGFNNTTKVAVVGGAGDFDLGRCVKQDVAATDGEVYVSINQPAQN